MINTDLKCQIKAAVNDTVACHLNAAEAQLMIELWENDYSQNPLKGLPSFLSVIDKYVDGYPPKMKSLRSDLYASLGRLTSS